LSRPNITLHVKGLSQNRYAALQKPVPSLPKILLLIVPHQIRHDQHPLNRLLIFQYRWRILQVMGGEHQVNCLSQPQSTRIISQLLFALFKFGGGVIFFGFDEQFVVLDIDDQVCFAQTCVRFPVGGAASFEEEGCDEGLKTVDQASFFDGGEFALSVFFAKYPKSAAFDVSFVGFDQKIEVQATIGREKIGGVHRAYDATLFTIGVGIECFL